MPMFKDRKSSPAQDATREMNLALGTLFRAISNLSRAKMVFADTSQGERLAVSLDIARRAYQHLVRAEGKSERSEIAKRANDRARQREAERKQLDIPF